MDDWEDESKWEQWDVDMGEMPQIKYGDMSFTDKMKFYKHQGGACALCRKKFEKGLDPVVDHCHDTGIVRGLLCSPCNTSLGYAEKRGINFLDRVRDYVLSGGDIFHTNKDYEI